MRVYGVRPVFIRHPLKSFLIGLGVLVGLFVAMTGIAVIAVLLVAGGTVAWVYRSLRGPASPSVQARPTAAAHVIDGEFEVVDETSKPTRYSHALRYDGHARG